MKPLAVLTVLGELRTREVRRYTFDNLDIPAADLTLGVRTLTWLVPICREDCVCLHRPSFMSREDWVALGACDYNEMAMMKPINQLETNPLAFVPRSETYFDASGPSNVAALFYNKRIILFTFTSVEEKERLLLYDGW